MTSVSKLIFYTSDPAIDSSESLWDKLRYLCCLELHSFQQFILLRLKDLDYLLVLDAI
jgi:hypothetical protein